MTTAVPDPRRLPVAAGVVAMLTCYGAAKALRAAGVPGATGGMPFGVVAVVFAVAGLIVGRRAVATPSVLRQTGHLLLGVPLGVLLWVFAAEPILRLVAPALYQDHNLFPFEIGMYWVFAALPSLIGVGIGRRLGAGAGAGAGG